MVLVRSSGAAERREAEGSAPELAPQRRRGAATSAAERPGVGPALLPATDPFSCSSNKQSKTAYGLQPPPLTPRPSPAQSVTKTFPPARRSRKYTAARRNGTRRRGCARRLGRGFKDVVGEALTQQRSCRVRLPQCFSSQRFVGDRRHDPTPHIVPNCAGPGLCSPLRSLPVLGLFRICFWPPAHLPLVGPWASPVWVTRDQFTLCLLTHLGSLVHQPEPH